MFGHEALLLHYTYLVATLLRLLWLSHCFAIAQSTTVLHSPLPRFGRFALHVAALAVVASMVPCPGLSGMQLAGLPLVAARAAALTSAASVFAKREGSLMLRPLTVAF